MVCNRHIILDEGQNKNLAETKMQTTIEQLDKLVRLSQMKTITVEPVWDATNEEYIEEGEIRNPDYNPNPNQAVRKWLEADDILLNPKIALWMKNKILADDNLKKSLFGAFGIIPFNPCVMINISPDWKDKIDPKDKRYQRLLNNTIYDYLNACNRYSKYRYALECGGEGNFLHAHIVAEINPALAKSVKTHINKGNHKYELIKAWKKNLADCQLEKGVKGIEGFLKGKFSVQRILINEITMRDDKLAYLQEENKPEGHTNAYNLNFIKGDF